MLRVESYKTRKFTYIRTTPKGISAFGEWIGKQNFESVFEAEGPDQKVEELHRLFDQGIKQSFERITQVRKTIEPPWMTDEIRDMISNRREVFRKDGGRSTHWRGFKRRTAGVVKSRKKTFYKHLKEKFTGADASRNFYKSVNGILRGYEEEHWDVRALWPGATDKELSEELAGFFNRISEDNGMSSLPNQEDPPANTNLPVITPEQVTDMITKNRRPSSTVPVDLPPIVYKHFVGALAEPISHVFNSVVAANKWPERWSREYITVIPKISSPEGFDDLRNIACTNNLSKVLERFVLAWARMEVTPKDNQFGGEKGCGPAHLLIEATQYVTSSLEDHRAAVIAISTGCLLDIATP